jgi:hypothetical protein
MVTCQDLTSELFVWWHPNSSRIPRHEDQIVIEFVVGGPFQWVDVASEFPDLFQYLFVREGIRMFRSVEDLILFLDEGQEGDFDKAFGVEEYRRQVLIWLFGPEFRSPRESVGR